MIGCTRCGAWHTDAEKTRERRLSCTEVRQFWARIRKAHREAHGHRSQISRDPSGTWICYACGKPVDLQEGIPQVHEEIKV